ACRHPDHHRDLAGALWQALAQPASLGQAVRWRVPATPTRRDDVGGDGGNNRLPDHSRRCCCWCCCCLRGFSSSFPSSFFFSCSWAFVRRWLFRCPAASPSKKSALAPAPKKKEMPLLLMRRGTGRRATVPGAPRALRPAPGACWRGGRPFFLAPVSPPATDSG